MPQLHTQILSASQINSELNAQIETLDTLAFESVIQNQPPEFAEIQWAEHQWIVLGFVDHQLAAQISLVKRSIQVGNHSIQVVGVGGVATHPDWQKHGFASQLLRATTLLIRNEIQVPFGLLICDDLLESFYSNNGWQKAAQSLYFWQDGKRRSLKACTMILQLTAEEWPEGEIDLCGSPW